MSQILKDETWENNTEWDESRVIVHMENTIINI